MVIDGRLWRIITLFVGFNGDLPLIRPKATEGEGLQNKISVEQELYFF